MIANVIIAPEAEQDITEAYIWYEERRKGLGEEFLSCVEACIQTIFRMPESYAVVFGNYRRALVRRFPFTIFYEVVNEAVTIYSVFHNSQDPKKWKTRRAS